MIRLASLSVIALSLSLGAAVAQTTPAPATTPTSPPAAGEQKKMSPAHLKELKANWKKNKPQLKECRKQVKAKGLAGDDRWFFIEDCMNKS